MIHIENEEQFNQTISEGIVLVDFYATWCGPCRMIAPFIEEIDDDYTGKINVSKVDVDECPNIASKYGINAIPALIIFKNGEIFSSNVGFMPKEEIVDRIENALVE